MSAPGTAGNSSAASGPPAAHGAIEIRVFDSFAAARPSWQRIESDGDAYAFQSYAWLSAWFETLGTAAGARPCIVVAQRTAEDPLILLPLAIEPRRGSACLTWMGGQLSDYQAPVLGRRFSTDVDPQQFVALWADIRRALPCHDVVLIEKQPAYVGAQPNPFMSLGGQPHASSAHLVHLEGDFESFLARTRSRKSLSTERRKRRKLAERGDLAFVIAKDQHQTNVFLDAMLRQKSANYRALGVTDILAQTPYRDFIRLVSARHREDGFVQLAGLLLDDRLIATHWGLLYRKRLYYLLPAYERGAFASLSPGNALLYFMLEWCFDNDVTVCDFTIGDEAYKYQWRDTELSLVDFMAPVTLRGQLYVQPLRAARRLKRLIKHSPALMGVAVALRARAAAAARRLTRSARDSRGRH